MVPGGNEQRAICSLLCSFHGVEHEITEDDFHNLVLAYAITVHKEGSQFRRMIMLVVKSRLLDRTLICTALTRVIRQVILVGDRQAFE